MQPISEVNEIISKESLLDGIKRQDTKVIRHIYEEYFPVIKRLILNNRGTDEDAQDVFQDALTMMYQKLEQDKLYFDCAFKTYLYAVSRNMWLMVLRKKRSDGVMLRDTEASDDLSETLVHDMTQARRRQVFKAHLQSLGQSCQQVLKLFFEGESLRVIASKMEFSEAYAKKKKYTCQQKLIAAIEQDSLFEELTEN